MPDWFPWALGSAVFAAFTALFAKWGLTGVDSDAALLVRTAVILVAITALLVATGKLGLVTRLPMGSWGWLVASGLATGASWWCYFRALQAGPVTQVAPVDKASVVLAVLLAVIFLGERPTLREWGGIAAIAGGVLLLAFKR